MSTRKPRTEEEWKAILLDYEQTTGAGGAVAEVLKKHNISSPSVTQARRRYGLKWKRGDKRNLAALNGQPASGGSNSKFKYPEESRQKAREMRAEGMSYQAIADELGVSSPGVVHTWMKGGKAKGKSAPAEQTANGPDVTAAIALLRRMDKLITKMIRQGKIERADNAHLLAQMALGVLTGDQ